MGQLVRRVRCVGRIALVVLQCRQRADQIVAGVENRQPGTNGAVRILARLQQLMQRQPSGDAFIAAFDKIQSAVREQFYRASAGDGSRCVLPPSHRQASAPLHPK